MKRIIKISGQQCRQLRETLNKNKIFKEINELILEKLSINDDVRLFADQIIAKAREEYKNAPLENYDGKAHQKHLSFTMNFIGYTVTIMLNVTICNPSDAEHYEANSDLTDCYSISKKKKANYIFLNFVIVNNPKKKVDAISNFYCYPPTIQHEVNHLYQQLMKGDGYCSKNVKAQDFYAFSNANIHSSDDIVRNVALAIYLTQYAEQDSFANELDMMLRTDITKIKDRDAYKQSDAYKRLQELQNCHQFLIKNKEKVISFIKKLKTLDKFINFNYGTLIDLCERGEKRMMNKIAHVAIRSCDNIQLEWCVRDCFTREGMNKTYLI